MKKTSSIIALLTCCFLLVRGQSPNLLLGHAEFKQLNYAKAILAYEAASDKNLKAYRNLAQCYIAIGKWAYARDCMEKVVDSDQPTANDIWGLAQLCMRLEDYPAADQVMASLYAKAPRDTRARTYRNAGDYRALMRRRSGQVEVAYQNFNSDEQDFGLAILHQQLVFASTRHPYSPVVQEWNGNQSSFSNLYMVNTSQRNARPKYFQRRFNSRWHDGPIAFSGDGKTCALTRNMAHDPDESGIRNLGLFLSTFDGEQWGELVPFPFNDSTCSVGHAAFNHDGSILYFASDRPGGRGGTDIWRAELHAGRWEAPRPVYSVNTEGDELFPYFLESAGVLLFASDGHVGLGGLDLFAAKQKAEAFFKIKNLGMPINTASDDFGIVMDDDMQAGYFCSNRPAPDKAKPKRPFQDTLALAFDDDIYSIDFRVPFSFGKTVAGIVLDDEGKPVEGAELALRYDGGTVRTATTSESGQFEFVLDTLGLYTIWGAKAMHFDGETTLRVTEDADEYTAQLTLNRDPNISIRLVITDSEVGAPMAGVGLTVVDLLTGDTTRMRTPENGEFFLSLPNKSLRDSISYRFILRLDGHLTKTLTYRHQLDRFGCYDIHKAKVNGRFLDFSMRKKTVRDDLALQLGILPYFFEGRDASVIPDTIGDLPVIVGALRDNPSLKIEVVAHTDCRGSDEANLALSEKRAKAIADYLKTKVPDGPLRIKHRGAGERAPKSGCRCEGEFDTRCTPEEYQIDRRTEFIILGI